MAYKKNTSPVGPKRNMENIGGGDPQSMKPSGYPFPKEDMAQASTKGMPKDLQGSRDNVGGHPDSGLSRTRKGIHTPSVPKNEC